MTNKKKARKSRNLDILKAYRREINLQTQVIPDKTKYNRKEKHKNIEEF